MLIILTAAAPIANKPFSSCLDSDHGGWELWHVTSALPQRAEE